MDEHTTPTRMQRQQCAFRIHTCITPACFMACLMAFGPFAMDFGQDGLLILRDFRCKLCSAACRAQRDKHVCLVRCSYPSKVLLTAGRSSAHSRDSWLQRLKTVYSVYETPHAPHELRATCTWDLAAVGEVPAYASADQDQPNNHVLVDHLILQF